MKYLIAALGLVCLCPVAHAQGYVSAVAALTRLSDSCTPGLSDCDDSKVAGFRISAGTELPKGQQLDLGIGRVSRIEVSAMRFGRANHRGTTVVRVTNPNTFFPESQNVPAKDEVSATALAVAAVAEFPVIADLSLTARLGVAYVRGTVTRYVDGLRNGSSSDNAIRPYAGIGLEYSILPQVRLQSGFDWTRYNVDGRSGSATQLGLGAAVSF